MHPINQRGLKSRSYHIQCCANSGLFDLCLPSLELLGDNAIISKLPTSVATGQWPNHALQLVTCTRHNSALTSTVGERLSAWCERCSTSGSRHLVLVQVSEHSEEEFHLMNKQDMQNATLGWFYQFLTSASCGLFWFYPFEWIYVQHHQRQLRKF